MEDKKYTVYKHTTPNGKVYIGITSKDPNKRWQNGTGYHHNEHWKSAIKTYGWENIKHDILFDNLTKEQAEQKEIELIELYKSNQREYGYNIATGGLVNSGFHLSEETKQKLSQAHKGKQLSDEHKKNISKGNTGRVVSEETKKKIGKSNKGKKLSEETRKKLSIKHKGIKQSQETINKRVEALKGKKRSQEIIEKYRECRPNKKRVIQMTLNGDFINCFSSIAEAERQTGVSRSKISLVCLHKRNKAGGFKWQSVEQNQNMKLA